MPTRLLKHLKHALRPPRPDARGRRFVAVIECLLNQNARDDGAARFPGMDFLLLERCNAHGVAIVQMPCPEVHALGYARQRKPGQSIRDALNDPACVQRCAALAREVAERIEAHLERGDRLIAILGGNPESPGCAIHQGSDGLYERSGLFMRQLQAEFRRHGREPRFHAIRDDDPALHRLDIDSLERLLTLNLPETKTP